MSRTIAALGVNMFNLFLNFSVKRITWCMVECLLRKPNCCGGNMMLRSSVCSFILALMIFSIILLNGKLIGL